MSEFAEFSRSLIESSKYFLELSKKETKTTTKQALLRASLYHSLSYVEAQVNDIADHFEGDDSLSQHEKGFLLEKDVNIENGTFVLSNSLKMSRLIERIEFLLQRFGAPAAEVELFAELRSSIKLRNSLAHPKEARNLTVAEVENSIKAAISTCDALAKAIFGKGLPYADRGLSPNSKY